jgi:hypothetical protein
MRPRLQRRMAAQAGKGSQDPPTKPRPAPAVASTRMPEALRIGVASAMAAALALVVLLASGMLEPVDLLFPGARSFGTPTLVDDFGAAAVPDRFSYDGQEIYFIARNMPNVQQTSRDGIAEFRLRRILQPLLAWPAPAGNATIFVLVLTNLVGLGLAAGALADLAARHGRDPRVGYAACIALVFPLAITTTEPLAFGLGLLGLALVDRRRLVAAVAALGLAGLSRETALVMAVAAGLEVARIRSWRLGALVAAVPVLVFAGWAVRLRQLVPSGPQPSELLGFLDLPAQSPLDVVTLVVTLTLMVVAVWRWRDVPLLWLTAAGFLGACAFYVGDSFQWEAFVRLSAVGIALGLAALMPSGDCVPRRG